MSDGAHQGVGAERALGTILGGEDQPHEEEKKTPAQVLDSIREQSFEDLDYGGTANACARLILEAYETYPQLRDHPVKSVYLSGSTLTPRR